MLKKTLKVGGIVLGLIIVVMAIAAYQYSNDPLKKTTDNIIESLEDRDKEKFDKYVDLEKLAENLSSWAAEEALDKQKDLEGKEKEQIKDLFGDSVVEQNKERYIKETEEYFTGEKEELVGGPLQFLLRNGDSNRESEYNEDTAKMIYTPPKGVDDTQKIFYFEKRDENWVLFDIRQGSEPDSQKSSENSSGREVAKLNGKPVYKKEEAGKEFLVVNGQEQTKYDDVSDVTAAGGKLGYIAEDGEQEFIVVDGQEKREYDDVGFLQEIGGKLAYIVEKGNKEFVVWGGEEQKKYDFVRGGCLKEISGKPSYSVKEEGKFFVVHGDKEYKEYNSSSYSREVNNELVFKARSGSYNQRKEFVVYGDEEKEGKRYDDISRLTAINNKLAYEAEEGDEKFVVHNEKEYKEYDNIREFKEAFDNDNQ